MVYEAGVQAHTQKFWFVENPGKNGAYRLTSFLKTFMEVTHNNFCVISNLKKSSLSLWDKNCRQMPHKNFSGKFGEIQAKILLTPKNLPASTPVVT